jgi:guanylate kinase
MEQVIGLTGPSGVGKGFAKKAILAAYQGLLVEPIVATTRPRRDDDGADRQAGMSDTEFDTLVSSGEIIFAHSPFNNNFRYGFLHSSFQNDAATLTEVHVDNIPRFREQFRDSLFLIGIFASKKYLESNLHDRDTTTSDLNIRLDAATAEVAKIKRLHRIGVINEIISVGFRNRETFASQLINLVGLRLGTVNN